jgi:hypothetical protein
MLAIDDDRFTGRIGEAHGQLRIARLHQGSLAFSAVDHGIVDDLLEIGLQAGKRAVDAGRTSQDLPRILRGCRGGQGDHESCKE